MPSSLTRQPASFSTHGSQRPLLNMVLALLLLSMQALVLQHQLDLDHHHHGNSCELCLHLSAIDHGLVDTLVLSQPAQPALAPVGTSPLQRRSESHTAYHSRAPPRFF